MMKLNIGLKSALVALIIGVAVPTATTRTAAAPAAAAASNALLNFVCKHKAKFVIAAIIYAIDTRLNTRAKPEVEFSIDDLRGDFQELLNNLNIFDTKLYKQLMFLFDKYVIGLKVKIEEASKKYPADEKGVSLTLKTKKLTQKPFGIYGLFDAYLTTPAKKFTTETLVALAGLYIFLTDPFGMWDGNVSETAKKIGMNISINLNTSNEPKQNEKPEAPANEKPEAQANVAPKVPAKA